MAERQVQRFSWTGMGVIAGMGVITYFLVQAGKGGLLGLYVFATGILVALLIAVAFDIGIKRRSAPLIEQEQAEADAPVPVQPAKVKSRKRRR
ncbi:MAG: hypothetical protein RMM98_09345 [Acidobacteriota bacterium]|nr:hypothetical protein [Blastocatellia bacterium]MDW8239809.1 hypothetical protein [Acidobacteriota bacterium]